MRRKTCRGEVVEKKPENYEKYEECRAVTKEICSYKTKRVCSIIHLTEIDTSWYKYKSIRHKSIALFLRSYDQTLL